MCRDGIGLVDYTQNSTILCVPAIFTITCNIILCDVYMNHNTQIFSNPYFAMLPHFSRTMGPPSPIFEILDASLSTTSRPSPTNNTHCTEGWKMEVSGTFGSCFSQCVIFRVIAQRTGLNDC